ncbi:MAG: hypothetical protein R3Y21_01840 [Mycoplasmatota bacterium]
MIDRILMELYDNYQKNDLSQLDKFIKMNFPNDGTDIYFKVCVFILFSRCSGYQARYSATREKLCEIILSGNYNNKNLLDFYINKVNNQKGILKIYNTLDKNKIPIYVDNILKYLNQFSPKFLNELKDKITNE